MLTPALSNLSEYAVLTRLVSTPRLYIYGLCVTQKDTTLDMVDELGAAPTTRMKND
jgi:hypothetical protein